jgi:16S rRNA (cytosine967-C5)-methyltransferase
MIAPAREAAYEALRAIVEGQADLPHTLARARARLPDERDRALLGEIVTGTLRWQGAIDRVISEFARRPLARLDREVIDILRAAIFQLLHLDRVPAAAVVSDAVNLTRKVGKSSAAPLVNALLRRVSRERERLPLPPRPTVDADGSIVESNRDAVLDYLATTLSHPRWLVTRWLERYGFAATESWLQFNNRPAPLTLRVNTLRGNAEALRQALDAHGVALEKTAYAVDGLAVVRGNPLLTPVAESGAFLVQDEASQLVAALVAAKPGERVLDACASPGGKTTAIAASMGDRGFIVATDIRERRIDLLASTVQRAGAQSVHVVQADASALPLAAGFDWVLLDAPCSGLGTLRRDPDLRWRRAESDIAPFAATQVRLLREAARVVRPGGRIVYATCSSEPDENEAVISKFLEDGGFRPAAASELPAAVRPVLDAAGHLRTYPFAHGLEGFFGAQLVRTS